MYKYIKLDELLPSIKQDMIKNWFKYYPLTGIVIKLRRNDISNKSSQTRWNNLANKPITTISNEGYLYTYISSKKYQLHNIIWLYQTGNWPIYTIDHINGKRNDNRWINLRDTNDNAKNIALGCNNTSGALGVSFDKYHNKWLAQIKYNKQCIYLGHYEDKSIAIQVRKEAEKKYNFHPNHGRQL